MNYEENPFVEFEHKMTEEQRQEVLDKLQMDATILKIGLAQKDASLVRHIFYDNELNWKCRYCPYKKPCEEMRIKVNAEKFNGDKK